MHPILYYRHKHEVREVVYKFDPNTNIISWDHEKIDLYTMKDYLFYTERGIWLPCDSDGNLLDGTEDSPDPTKLYGLFVYSYDFHEFMDDVAYSNDKDKLIRRHKDEDDSCELVFDNNRHCELASLEIPHYYIREVDCI